MSWVGGDPGQLAEVGQRLIGVPGQISSGVTTPIANLAGQVCTAAGWTGAAADAFVQHWGQASAGATVVGALYDAAGRAVYELAEHLCRNGVLDRHECSSKRCQPLPGRERHVRPRALPPSIVR